MKEKYYQAITKSLIEAKRAKKREEIRIVQEGYTVIESSLKRTIILDKPAYSVLIFYK